MVGAKPPGYARRRWTYPNDLFIEQPTTVKQIAAALSGKTIRIGRRAVRLAPLQPTASRTRLQSYADFGGQRMEWPTTRYELSRLTAASASAGHDPLVSLESPSFAHYEAAYAAFFRPGGPSRWQQSAGVVISDLDTDAGIAGLTIQPGEVVVEVSGDNLKGCGLQGSSGGRSYVVTVARRGTFRLPLPDPFVNELLIVLADGERWRDLRLLNPPGQANTADPSIVWDDPGFELAVLLAGGEGAGVEFKSRLPAKSTESIRTALKAAPAFANGAGGVLIFGVDDEGQVVGLEDDVTEAVARLTNLIHDHIHPLAPHHIESQIVDGKAVLLVHVGAGAEKPYAMFRDPPQFSPVTARRPSTQHARKSSSSRLGHSRPGAMGSTASDRRQGRPSGNFGIRVVGWTPRASAT